MHVRICQLIRLGIRQIWDFHPTVFAKIFGLQIATDAPLSCLCVKAVTVVQDHQLNVAKERLDRIVVRTRFRQADIVQLELAHDTLGFA